MSYAPCVVYILNNVEIWYITSFITTLFNFVWLSCSRTSLIFEPYDVMSKIAVVSRGKICTVLSFFKHLIGFSSSLQTWLLSLMDISNSILAWILYSFASSIFFKLLAVFMPKFGIFLKNLNLLLRQLSFYLGELFFRWVENRFL